MRRLIAVMIAAGALTACRVDDTRYVFPGDGDGGVDGADSIDAAIDAGARTILVGPVTVTIREGETMTEAVRLSSAPTGSVTVMTTLPPSSGLTVTPATLTFTDEDWDREQYVFVEAIEDADAVDSQKSIVFMASGFGSVSLPVSIVDNDTLAIFAAPGSINVTEGLTGTVQVRLTAQPIGDVNVSVSSDTTAAATVSPSSLTFTGGPTGNWSAPQTVTVTGAQDLDGVDGTAIVSASASGMNGATVMVHVTDDEVLAIVPSSISFAMTEGTVKTDFTVGLTIPPPGSLIVQVTSSDPAVTVAPTSLTFTTATPQPVTVTAVNDDNYANAAVTITLSVAGGMPTPRDVAVAVTDNDQQAIVTVPGAVLTVAESGTAFVDVRLAFRPPASTVVGVSTLLSPKISVDQPSLTFTTANFATNQRVIVSGLSDNDLATDTATLRLSNPDAADHDLAVTITDNDTQTIVTSADSLSFDEGTQTTFTARLGFVPLGDVTLSIGAGNVAVTPSPTSLLFSADDYDVPRTVTVSSPSDGDLMNLMTTVTVSGAGASPKVLPTTVNDTTSQDILVSPNTLTVTETQTGTLTVKLGASPGASSVTVSVVSSDPSIATVSPSSVVLTSANYLTGVPVMVTGANDLDIANESTTVVFSASGLGSKSVTITVIDNDTIQVNVTPRILPLEETASGAVTVTLSATPAVDIVVSVAPQPGVTSSRATITFPAGVTPATESVTLTAVRDDDIVLDDTTVNFNPNVGTGDAIIVRETVDHTVIIGYPGMLVDPGSESAGGLEAWSAPTFGQGGPLALPLPCYQVDKVAVVQKTPSPSGAVEIGLYSTGMGPGSDAGVGPMPTGLLFDSGMRSLTGVGINTFPAPASTTICPPSETFIAMQAMGAATTPMFGISQQLSVRRCQRTPTFWGLPMLFSGSGCSTDNTPLQVWLIGHVPFDCTCASPL